MTSLSTNASWDPAPSWEGYRDTSFYDRTGRHPCSHDSNDGERSSQKRHGAKMNERLKSRSA